MKTILTILIWIPVLGAIPFLILIRRIKMDMRFPIAMWHVASIIIVLGLIFYPIITSTIRNILELFFSLFEISI